MGLKTRKKKNKWILPTAKRQRVGVLPVLPLLGILRSLVGGAAEVVKAVNDNKVAQRQLQELQRYNRAMEGRGIYLALYKRGQNIARRNKTCRNVKNTEGSNYRCATAIICKPYAIEET